MLTAGLEHPGGLILPHHLQHVYVHGEPLPQHVFGGPSVTKAGADACSHHPTLEGTGAKPGPAGVGSVGCSAEAAPSGLALEMPDFNFHQQN